MVDTDKQSGVTAEKPDIVRRAFSKFANADALPQLRRSLGDGPFAAVFLFVSSDSNFADIVQSAELEFAGIPVNACTTAGEISDEGYSEGSIVAVALPTSHFDVRSIFVDNVKDINQEALVGTFIGHRLEMATLHPTWNFEFAFTLIDGFSMGEEALLKALGPGLGGIGLFGGSAGDGLRFEQSWVAYQGQIHRNAAVVTVVRTRCPVKVFSLDHFKLTDKYLVVTEADPETRTVTEINAEPAVSEYARIHQLPETQVDLHAFASKPLAVQVGDTHHLRAIMRGDPDGTLEFASAIDVGLVLRSTVAGNIKEHLMGKLADLSETVRPDAILACDCLARKVEIGDLQATTQISSILSENSVIGFNTMGEQIDTLHVNHTMTGVAIYPPDDGDTDLAPC